MYRVFGDVLDLERIRQVELTMQRTIEKTRDVRRRPNIDALRVPFRCGQQRLAVGMPERRKKIR